MISVLCPSRGRPKELRRMMESALDTSYNPNCVDFLVYVDDNDKTRDKYPDASIIGPPLPLGPAYQYLYNHSLAPIVMMAADDLIFRTKDWDRELINLAPEHNCFVCSFDDLGRPRKENGHPFIGRKFVELVGYFTYPRLKHSCVDNWVVDIANKAGCFLYADFIIEHVHPKYQKGEWDNTYLENTKDIKTMDGAVYLGAEGRKEIEKAAQRVRDYLEPPQAD